MSFSKPAVPCLAALATFASFASLATVAHADESTTRGSLAVEASAPPPAPRLTPAPRLQLTGAFDFGLIQASVEVGLRYEWFEADLGARGYFDTLESYVGMKLLLQPEHTVVPYLYGQIGNWKDSGGYFGKTDGSKSGALAAGGLGLEVHMGDTASFLLRLGVDHEYGTDDAATRLEAGIGFGVRL